MKLTQLERALLRTLQAYQEAGRSRGAVRPQEPSVGNVRDALVQVAGFYPDEAVKNVETWLAQRAEHTACLSRMLADMRPAPRASTVQTVQEPQSLVTQLNIDVVRSGPKLHGKWVLPAGTSLEDWVTKIRKKESLFRFEGVNYVVRGEPFTPSKGARVGAVRSAGLGVYAYNVFDEVLAGHYVVAGFSSNSKKS